MDISTERLRLRPISENDLAAFHTLQSCTEVAQWTSQGPSKSLQRSSEMLDDLLVKLNISTTSEPTVILAITIVPSTELVGLIGTFRPREVGFSLLPKFWGKGYAREACKAFCKRYLEVYPGQHLFAKVNAGNDASKKCLRSCGFTPASEEEINADELLGTDQRRETWLLRRL